MSNELPPTRILIVDSDDASFEIRQCIAQTLEKLPPVELFHARDATEALSMLERLCPDVILLDDNEPGEHDLFMDSLIGTHPPIVVCTESCSPSKTTKAASVNSLDQEVTYLPKDESLEGVHLSLMKAAEIGIRSTNQRASKVMH